MSFSRRMFEDRWESAISTNRYISSIPCGGRLATSQVNIPIHQSGESNIPFSSLDLIPVNAAVFRTKL
ncbi:hypothetical protein QTP88_012885 [Uroleucon formosanum]